MFISRQTSRGTCDPFGLEIRRARYEEHPASMKRAVAPAVGPSPWSDCTALRQSPARVCFNRTLKRIAREVGSSETFVSVSRPAVSARQETRGRERELPVEMGAQDNGFDGFLDCADQPPPAFREKVLSGCPLPANRLTAAGGDDHSPRLALFSLHEGLAPTPRSTRRCAPQGAHSRVCVIHSRPV